VVADIEKTSTNLFKGWSDIKNVARAIRNNGLLETSILIRHSLANRLQYYLDRNFDKKNNVDTDYVALNDLDISSENVEYGIDYIPTSAFSFKRFIEYLPRDLRDFTFVDFGSGKGKAILIASHYPFKNVIGIEFSEDMVRMANKNIQNQNAEYRKCQSISSKMIDATKYKIPDEKLILYFFDPFQSNVMEVVVGNIIESYKLNPRPIYIVYHEPAERKVFDSSSFFEEIKQNRYQFLINFLCPYQFVVYRMTGLEN